VLKIRLLCVDDHPLVREGIARVISRMPDIEVVGLAGSGDEAIALYRQGRPDVVLMDLLLKGGMTGVDAIKAIRRLNPAARIIVVSVLQGESDIYDAFQAGATTYLFKDMLSDELVRVIRDVHAGRPVRHPQVESVLAERAMLFALGGGCLVPIGALGTVAGGELTLRGAVLDPAGRGRVDGKVVGPASESEGLGRQLAEELLGLGAKSLLRASGI
jgi:CheY-like chemotaxis protein